MKRRHFLKTIAGILGAVVAGAKIEPAPIAPPAVAPALPSVQWIVDEACDSDRVYFIDLSKFQEPKWFIEQYLPHGFDCPATVELPPTFKQRIGGLKG